MKFECVTYFDHFRELKSKYLFSPQMLFAQLLGPVRSEAAEGGSGDGVLEDVALRGEEPAHEVASGFLIFRTGTVSFEIIQSDAMSEKTRKN